MRLWIELDLPRTQNFSKNNCGNILEQMMWLAFESGRYNWILGVATWCAKSCSNKRQVAKNKNAAEKQRGPKPTMMKHHWSQTKDIGANNHFHLLVV